jgi:tetratricopeptide (TPR) repeat protein
LSPRSKRLVAAGASQVLLAAGFLFLVCALLVASSIFIEDPPGFLSFAAKVVGVLAALVGIGSGIVALREARDRPPAPVDVRSPKLRSGRTVVNRTEKVADLVEELETSEVVNCHGPRGSGKSFMLQYLTDVVNGHRQPNPDHNWPRHFSAALYFDLADAIGFAGIESQVCRASFGQDGSWGQFMNYVAKRHRSPMLLVLDNVNSPSLWTPVGKAVGEYLLARDHDKILLGSIERLHFDNQAVGEVSIDGLDVTAFTELVHLEGLPLEEPKIVELYTQWHGLPYYAGPRGARHAALAERVELAGGTRRLAAYAALLAVTVRPVPLADLKRCPIADFDTHLEDAIREQLVEPTAEGRFVTMHDIAREETLVQFQPEVTEAAAILFERARQRGERAKAVVFAMFAAPSQLDSGHFDEVLRPAIRNAVEARDYALLETLHERSRTNQRMLEFLAEDRSRSDLFSFGRAAQLAGLGSYEEAEEELLETSVATVREAAGVVLSELQLELKYLQIDIAHLLNRYGEAAIGFERLAETARISGDEELRARCIWAQAHVLRHQGRDLERALMLFEEAEKLGGHLDLLSVKSLSITGASMIKVFLNSVPDDEEERLERLEQEIAASQSHDGHMLGIWKAMAQVDWIRGRRESAINRVEDAIQNARATNDRLLYDLLFERAEFLRLGGSGSAALQDYARAFRFGTGNRDRNMTSIALLGLVLADMSLDDWEYHASQLEARGSAMQARDMAVQADIQVTKQLAENVVARLDGAMIGLPTRLINF